ncbi:hypothetical protein Tcan_03760 [Toxocara canis]|uniref:Uncharacterized protein n=1 Tax=Toxocara canis TaxID=6265 RepID=A0A0B2URR0_TOXCA|nr:hypothetical protein Tcan_03760 [Toxocara canis]
MEMPILERTLVVFWGGKQVLSQLTCVCASPRCRLPFGESRLRSATQPNTILRLAQRSSFSSSSIDFVFLFLFHIYPTQLHVEDETAVINLTKYSMASDTSKKATSIAMGLFRCECCKQTKAHLITARPVETS